MFENYILMMILAAFIGTYLSRVLPYCIFKHKEDSKNLLFIQQNMPLLIIVVLFFYTFYGVDFTKSSYGLSMILACVFVFFFHLKFKNALLSIVLGTIFYMICLRF